MLQHKLDSTRDEAAQMGHEVDTRNASELNSEECCYCQVARFSNTAAECQQATADKQFLEKKVERLKEQMVSAAAFMYLLDDWMVGRLVQGKRRSECGDRQKKIRLCYLRCFPNFVTISLAQTEHSHPQTGNKAIVSQS